ncbi:MAG: alkaline phosphatase family protein [SAR202 cluster bacterium]|nr:alkaline phosphatase family protein [SAR202 cluster bacterium]
MKNILENSINSGSLILPTDKKFSSIVDLSKTLAKLSGNQFSIKNEDRKSDELLKMIGIPEHLVFVIIDGLGMNILRNLDSNNFLNTNLKSELLTVFPSSTPVALTSFSTGLWPSEHGITNWFTYLPEINKVSTIIHFSTRAEGKNLAEFGLTPKDVYKFSSIIENSTYDAKSILPSYIANSEFSLHWQSPSIPYEKFSDGINITIDQIKRAKNRSFTLLYSPIVDATAHQKGVYHEDTIKAAQKINNELDRLYSTINGQAKIIVTADHGLLDIPKNKIFTIPNNELKKCINNEPWGDMRAVFFDVKKSKTEEFQNLLLKSTKENFALLTIDEVVEMGLFGPNQFSSIAKSRIGTHLAISLGESIISYKEAPYENMVGAHSGITPEELFVPLIIA